MLQSENQDVCSTQQQHQQQSHNTESQESDLTHTATIVKESGLLCDFLANTLDLKPMITWMMRLIRKKGLVTSLRGKLDL